MKKCWFVAMGAAAAGAVAGLANSGLLHKAAVATTCAGMKVAVVDDANDVAAEARRQAKIDAAVADRLSALEADIRAEVTAKIDAEGAEA